MNYADIVVKQMEIGDLCGCNKVKKDFTSPFPTIKTAFSNKNDEYGNIQTITSNTMRQNYRQRIEYIMNDNTNEVGVSSGGGEYIVPNYKHHFKQFYKPDCENFGLQKFKNAYGKGNDGQCKIHYEDY